MSKLPSSTHRSISVRQQPAQTIPHLRKSASTYGIDHTASIPVEIGTKGSVFSLVNRDIDACAVSSESIKISSSKKGWNYWHSRVWFIPQNLNSGEKHKLAESKTVSSQSVRGTKTPKWKGLLKNLKRGSFLSRGNKEIKNNEKTRADLSRDDMRSRDTIIPALPLPQTSDAPISLIWERRSFAQISPLDLSHLYTARIKKELGQRG